MGWIFFIPAGFISTSIAQFFFRWGNSKFPYIAELLAVGVEPWAFYLGALAFIPKFPIPFMVLSGLSYLILHSYRIYQYHYLAGYSLSPWAETILSLVAIISCLISIYWYSNSGLNEIDRVFDE